MSCGAIALVLGPMPGNAVLINSHKTILNTTYYKVG